MRVLVTGGSGFIGSHVVDKLRDKGVTVRVFDMVFPTFRSDIEFYHGSILDLEYVRMALNGVDAVMHLAAVADVRAVLEAPHYSEAINVRGTINVLEAMRLSGVKRMVLASTTWVYSDVPEVEVDETTPLAAPSHLYTATKIAAEHYCRSYAALYGIEPTVLRYGIPYGPRARAGAVIPIFVGRAMRGEPITIQGDGLQFRKFVYVEDLAEGNVLGLIPGAVGQTYNLDGAEKITIRQIAETVKSILGDVQIDYTPARPGDFSGKEVSSAKALADLGWESRTSLEEGVRRYVDWYRQQGEESEARWALVDDRLWV